MAGSAGSTISWARIRADIRVLALDGGTRRHLPGLHDQSKHGRKGALGVAKAVVKAAKKVASPKSVRQSGRNRVGDVVRDIRADPSGVGMRNVDNYDSPVDLHLQHIAHRQGFDAQPRVGTRGEVDAAVAAGWVEVWRGAEGADIGEIHDRLRHGAYEPGHGTYGNGLYTSTRRVTAERYRGRWIAGNPPASGDYGLEHVSRADVPPDSLLRIAIDPAARVGRWDDVTAELAAWRQTMPDDSLESEVLSDPGRFATARGYDVLLVTGQDDGGQYPPGAGDAPFAAQYIVLNRSVMLVQRAQDEP